MPPVMGVAAFVIAVAVQSNLALKFAASLLSLSEGSLYASLRSLLAEATHSSALTPEKPSKTAETLSHSPALTQIASRSCGHHRRLGVVWISRNRCISCARQQLNKDVQATAI